MSRVRFRLHRRAQLAYHTLTPGERDALDAAVSRLVDLPEEDWPGASAIRLDSAEPLYVLKIDRSLRALVRPAPGGQPEVEDLVRHETLERFFKGVG
jgi:hypothetical protein